LNNSLKLLVATAVVMLIISGAMPFCSNFLDWNNNFLEWLRDAMLNASCGVLASILLIYLYDRKNAKKAEEDRVKRQQIALNFVHSLLEEHFIVVLFGMFKAATSGEEIRYNTLDEVFSNKYWEEVKHLDMFSSPFDDRTHQWHEIITNYCQKLVSFLFDKIIVPYGIYLDSYLLEELQYIIYSSFINEATVHLPNAAKQSWGLRELNRVTKIAGGESLLAENGLIINYSEEFCEALRMHIVLFIELVEVFNKTTHGKKLELTADPWNLCLVGKGKCRASN